jgi:hypothetical protein
MKSNASCRRTTIDVADVESRNSVQLARKIMMPAAADVEAPTLMADYLGTMISTD